MKAQVAGSNGIAGSAVTRHSMVRKVLLACGILSSLLYVATTILAAMQWEGYSATSQAISELFAIGAPSRPLAVALLVAYDILIYAFGLGVWRSAGRKRALRVAAVMIIGKEVLGLVATVFTPLHLRGAEGTLSDTMHIALTGVGLVCMTLAMGFGAAAFGKRFRIYSIGTLLTFVVCGILAFWEAARIAASLPTPWLGVTERINIFGYMLWIVVLAINVWRVPVERPQDGLDGRSESIVHPEAATNRG